MTNAQHWDRWNLDMDKRGPSAGERTSYMREVLADFDRFGIAEGAALLDVGVGAGWTTAELSHRFEYVGVDLSPEGIAAAMRRNPKAELHCADFIEWRPRGARFDAIICMDTIMCLKRQDEAISKMFELLKPGGVLVISGVNPFVFSRLGWVGAPERGQERAWLSRGELHAMLRRHGFELERSRTILPSGDQGWLRLVNGRRVDKLLGPRYTALKNALGLGQFRIVTAKKPL